jgi:hypothetical protein
MTCPLHKHSDGIVCGASRNGGIKQCDEDSVGSRHSSSSHQIGVGLAHLVVLVSYLVNVHCCAGVKMTLLQGNLGGGPIHRRRRAILIAEHSERSRAVIRGGHVQRPEEPFRHALSDGAVQLTTMTQVCCSLVSVGTGSWGSPSAINEANKVGIFKRDESSEGQ